MLPVHQGLSGKPGADGPQGPVGMYVSEIPSHFVSLNIVASTFHVAVGQ